ncbi:uncharacterized protein DNG_00433 [Cephalotrichum gorgonifer]|uniref:Homeobox domain-containing protein n=1 Tax=Cephalotrichum gorgonifer TaxID=2041049 RepID=A0AAE8MPY8_9PEZI|nr:uncharacterized protein DNG_00433 [Cephalotrichum gorgonifer]
MAYFHHEFQPPQPAHADFNNTHLYQEQDQFQPSQDMNQFALHGTSWADPYARGTLLQSHRTETKPRLSKAEVEQLEAEFQKNNKPSSSVKKGLAEQMRVEVARINNWFQNRRAKKKQELKALEHEANAEAEKAKTESPRASDTNEALSSAEQSTAAIKSESQSPEAFDSDISTTEQSQSQGSYGLAGSYGNGDPMGYASPEDGALNYNYEQAFGFPHTDNSTYMTSDAGHDLAGMVAPSNPDFPSGAGVSGPMNSSMEGHVGGLEAFSYPSLMYSGLHGGMAPYEAQVDGIKEEHFASETVHQSIEPHYHQPTPRMNKPNLLMTEPFRLKSPPAVDLAGRRKQPGLALSGIRTVSNGPATGVDFSRRTLDPGSPMRRVTSATGFGPQGIRRFPSHQRVGIPDRRQESLLQAVRSPKMGPPSNSMAPPTPDTPVVVTQQSFREATVSSNSSEEEGSFLQYPQANVSSQHSALDQSIRTPPATPIGLGDVFATSLGASLGFPPTDEPFLPSGMESYPMGSNEFALPQYVVDGYISQPSTPQPAMPTSYYAPMPMHNTEYGVADATMVPAKSSSRASQRQQLQFSNFTPQDFNGGK